MLPARALHCSPWTLSDPAFWILAMVILLQFSGGAIRAQSTFGSFVGTVRDPTTAVIPSVAVTVINKGTAARRSTLTDADGSYVFVNLEPGTYEITFVAPGFHKASNPKVELLARETVRVDGNMALAAQVETVNVMAASEAVISSEVSNIAETKVGRELIDLPIAIASRASGSTSPISTLTTQPGVQADGSGNISVVGAKPAMLSMTLDGVSTSSAKSGAPIAELFPSFEGIAEIHVSEINNTAEFGGVSDITTISKSGGNDFHGSLFYNFQNAFMNARNPFSTTVPKLVMNDFGGSLGGGPVSVPKLYSGKNKTFFFLDYEGLRLPRSSTEIRSLPTAAMRTGDLSVYLPRTVVRDPLTAGTPFPNNQIPLNRIADLSQRAMNLYWTTEPNYGAPGAVANNYSENFPTSIASNQGDLRVDQVISPKQTAFARVTYKRRQNSTAPSGPVVLGGGNSLENDYALSGAYNYVLTPRVVNELRIGVSGQNTGTGYGYTSVQIVQALGLTLPGPPPEGAASTGFTITGFSGTGGGTTSLSRARNFQLLNNVTWTKGRHTIKFGGDMRSPRGLYTNVFASGRMSSYTFNNSAVTSTTIGQPFAAFLLGIPDSMAVTTVQAADSDGTAWHHAGYAQDAWRVSSRLTVNFGLRWEYHPNYRDRYDNTANFIQDWTGVVDGVSVHGAVVIPDAAVKLVDPSFRKSIYPTPIFTATQAGLPQSLRYSVRTNFAPRVGFAWRVTSDGKTVIRGGYGKFIEALAGSGLNAAWAVEASFVGRYTNSFVNGKPLYTFPYPFPADLAQPGTESFQLASEIHYRDPYVQQWNLTIEREIGFRTGLRVTYDGSHGTHLGIQYNANQIASNTVGFTKAALPYPLFNTIATYGNGARSNYNGLTITANRRFVNGLQFQASYGLAKNLSNGGGASPSGFATESGGSVSDRFNYELDYGNVAYTRRHRFQTTFLYMPQVNHKNPVMRHVVNGWEVAGVLLFQTGAFLTVTTSGADPSGTGSGSAGSGGTVRADRVLGVGLYPEQQGPSMWLNAAAFAVPPNNIGRFGSSPVGSVVGPGTQAISLSLFRSVNFSERLRLRVGVSAANSFNHPNWGNPSLTLGNATFGTITSLQPAEAGPRQIQLTARVTF